MAVTVVDQVSGWSSPRTVGINSATVGWMWTECASSEAGWWMVAGCGISVLALGLASTTRRAQVSAERVSRELGGAGPAHTEAQPAGA